MVDFAMHRDAFKARQKKGRDSRFKSDVLGGYYFTCALTGYRLDTTRLPVQAAHIHQHAVSGNDDPRNGLALTPDAHWMFDAGLWTAVPQGSGLLVVVATSRSPKARLAPASLGLQRPTAPLPPPREPSAGSKAFRVASKQLLSNDRVSRAFESEAANFTPPSPLTPLRPDTPAG